MLTEQTARAFAAHWAAAWNAHDLDAILSHYHDDVVLVSPVAVRLLQDPSGTVRGKAALRAYFTRGLSANPDLRFELQDVTWGLSSVVLFYLRQNGIRAGEFMELDPAGKVTRVVAHYAG